VTEGSNDDGDRLYQDFEKKTVEAFNRWHRFHEDLLKLGDFSTWLSDDENQVDLVTFFALDKENVPSYNRALTHQGDFLGALQQMIEHTKAMLEDYESGKDGQEEEPG
jgi:hypothetical protein